MTSTAQSDELEELTDDEFADPQPEKPGAGIGVLLPRSRAQVVVAVLALMFLAGALGYLIGRSGDESDAPSAESADVGFLYDMSSHHEQAVRLSMIELTNGSNPSVQAFAREIIQSQSYEIGLMRMRLGTWGFDTTNRPRTPMAWMGMSLATADAMPGMADAAEFDTFRSATGEDVDAMFLALMSDHHAGGVAMAEAAASDAEDEWVRNTADRMARIQASEIAEMEFARNAAGLDANPPGFVSDFGPNGFSGNGMIMDDDVMDDGESDLAPTDDGG